MTHDQAAPAPGWWLATDGRWYPPEQYPGVGPYPGVTAHGWWQATDGQWYPWAQHPAAGTVSPSFGPPSFGPPPTARPRGGLWIALLLGGLALAGPLLVAGVLASRTDDDPDTDTTASTAPGADDGADGGDSGLVDPDPAGLPAVIGTDDEPWNVAAAAAIADLQDFWAEEMRSTFGTDFVPIAGGFYAFSPGEALPPCVSGASEVEYNAFYCPTTDAIAWDDTFLLPEFYEFSGDLGVALVLAHEWGHAVQERVGFQGATIAFEQQADCYAGAWFDRVRDGESGLFRSTEADLDRALANLLELGDQPGVAANDPFAHGSAFDRINAFEQGLDRGTSFCATISNETLEVTALPFTPADIATGGDLPFDEMLDLAVEDLEAWWSAEFPRRHGAAWTPLAGGLLTYQGGNRPDCDDPASGTVVFYCPDGDFVAVQTDGAALELYNSFGDFAVGSLLGIEYARAVQTRLGIDPAPLDAALQADCLAGAWAASTFPANVGEREADGTFVIVLSPGDLDEAAATLLVLGGEQPEAGTGFQRVTSFRDGFVDGADAC